MDGFPENASKIPAARVLQNFYHVFVTPDASPESSREMRETVQMIVVHVTRKCDVDRLEPVPRPQRIYAMLHKPHAIIRIRRLQKTREEIPARRPVIDEKRLAA